jgi:hypothetical protein
MRKIAIVATGKGVSFKDALDMKVSPFVTVCQLEEPAFFIGCFEGQAACDCRHAPEMLLGEKRRF